MNSGRKKSVTVIEGGKAAPSPSVLAEVVTKLQKQVQTLEHQVAELRANLPAKVPVGPTAHKRWTEAENLRRAHDAVRRSKAGDKDALKRFFDEGGWTPTRISG